MKKSNTHRDRVYEIAREYVFQRGVAGWNMDDLARDAGVTKRTLYKMIESKEKLIGEIINGFIKGVQERIAVIISEEQEYYKAVRNVMAEFPALAGSMNSRSISDIFIQYPDVEKQVIAGRNELTAGVIAFFERGIKGGHLRKDLTGGFILELFQAMVIYFIKISNGGEAFSKNITAAFGALMDGLKTDAADETGGKK